MKTFGWTVLTLVFVDELLAMAAFGVWGYSLGGPVRLLLAVVLPIAVMAIWWAFASPKAPYGGPVLRYLVIGSVFCLASLALWHAGHPGWALAFFTFSAVINCLALIPPVRALNPTRRENGAVDASK
ncbi:YrdB family protein [Nocardioides speluncae]|uniref:YrdB family protein n=1 Tax=Nocardioides speluncae TaxID=2670337 RepID=UPI000D69196A|nr:YrdB family protein [Nocardioides speluncae]